MPVKSTPAGGYAYTATHFERVNFEYYETYQADTRTNDSREVVEDGDCRIKPLGIFITTRFVEPRNLFSKCGKNGIRGIASFKFSK